MDHTTFQKIDLEGFGAANSSKMNSSGAEGVFQKVQDSFPETIPYQKRIERAY